jgi:hypothetical protein
MKAMQKNKDRAGKALGGPRSYGRFMDALKRELGQADSQKDDYLEKMNDNVYNRLLMHLRRWKLAGAPMLMTKFAAEAPQPNLADLMKNLPEPPKTKGKTTGKGKGFVRAEKDPQVEALQTALNNAGISVKVDGWWGPRTAQAYNDFISKNIGVEKYLQPIANPKAQRHANRPAAILPKAVNIVRYLAGREKEIGSSTIELGGGIEVPIDVMNAPQNFADHMQRALNSRTFPPASALQYLNELEQYVSANAAEMEGKQAGTARMWQQAVRNLTGKFQQFERQAKGNKAFQYPWQQGQQGQQGQQQGGQPGSDLINPFPERGGAGGQPGQPGQPYGYRGLGGGAAGQNTLVSVQKAFDALPRVQFLRDPKSFERLARNYGGSAALIKRIDDTLAKIQNSLDVMGRNITKDQEAQYNQVLEDSSSYSTMLDNLKTALGIK